MDKKGMTLLEIVISMLILSLVTIGTANVFISAKKHVILNRSKMVAIGLARSYLESLQVNVTQDTWDLSGNNLCLGVYPPFNDTFNPGMNYTIRRKVDTNPAAGIDARRVTLTIAWDEKSS
ncbi:MAG: type II secretion system protein [Candidatus Omnitrophota bacterium]|nr:type II secretion system GspH family protein [Candidatus Omnitrophota bacterium]MBU1929465.1 type II secretion system GspH family protein [Candidatus Omnitrophota bacterium]MBU2034690.1 type II secretion system GspH family protein [Candidatus Omnitrophota bacterium]MBU2257876.1 type II secretion system GspH family protein [Candidatus Omnitrophota bacterium]